MEVVGEDGEVSYELEHCDIPRCSELDYCEEVRERAWNYGRPEEVPSYALVTNQASRLEGIIFLQTRKNTAWVSERLQLMNTTLDYNFTEALRYPSSIEVRTVSKAPPYSDVRVWKNSSS